MNKQRIQTHHTLQIHVYLSKYCIININDRAIVIMRFLLQHLTVKYGSFSGPMFWAQIRDEVETTIDSIRFVYCLTVI